MPWCPKCKCEYIEGIKVCVDCNIPLVDELPENDKDENNENVVYEYVKFVTVATPSDLGLLAIAKSILISAEIRYLVKGEFAGKVGRIVHPIEIQVPESDAPCAKELLKEIGL